MTAPGSRRRDFLRGAGAALAAARWAAAAPLVGCGGGGDADAVEIARAYFAGDRSGRAASIGEAYRAALEDAGSSVDQELAPLIETLERGGPRILDELAAAVAAEFRAVDVVRLGGWTFSPTELGLCALVSLG